MIHIFKLFSLGLSSFSREEMLLGSIKGTRTSKKSRVYCHQEIFEGENHTTKKRRYWLSNQRKKMGSWNSLLNTQVLKNAFGGLRKNKCLIRIIFGNENNAS